MAQANAMYSAYTNEYVDYDDYTPAYDRIYVRSSVYLPGSEIDPRTGMLKPDKRRSGRTQALRMERDRLERSQQQLLRHKEKIEAERGIRIPRRYAFLLYACVAFVLCMIMLVQQGNITGKQKSLNSINASIKETQTTNDQLTLQVETASERTRICYKAAQDYGMIPSESAEAIRLTAFDIRPTQPDSLVATAQTAPSVDTVAAVSAQAEAVSEVVAP